MIKKKGLKELTLIALSAALVTVACGDDDDSSPGVGGSSGSSTGGTASAGKSNGGSAGSGTAGKTAGGTAAGGSSTAGTGNEAGATTGGVPTDGGSDGEGGETTLGGANAGGAGGEGGEPPVAMDTFKNGGFESPLVLGGSKPPDSGTKVFPEWDNTATPDGSSYVQWADVKSGDVRLAHYNAAAYTAHVSQTVSPIANGTYAFSIWVKRAAADKFNDSYIFAEGFDAADLEDSMEEPTDLAGTEEYVQITLSPIVVSSNKLIVGIHSDGLPGAWANFDDAELKLIPE